MRLCIFVKFGARLTADFAVDEKNIPNLALDPDKNLDKNQTHSPVSNLFVKCVAHMLNRNTSL